LGATAVDDRDGDLTNAIYIDASQVDTSIPGTYSVTYSVTDSDGKTGTATRTVMVEDTTPPVITLLGDDPQVVSAGDNYTESGASATDSVDGDLTSAIAIDSSSVDTQIPGEYTVTYNVSDAAGNAAAALTRTIIVVPPLDTTPPVITLNGSNPQIIDFGAAYTELGASANDNVDGDLSASIVIDATSVDTSAPGNYSVTYDVTDAAGNVAVTQTRTVTVLSPVVLRGTVYDEAGAAVSGATVRVGSISDTTDIDGAYELVGLQSGSITLTAEAGGFEPHVAMIELAAGPNTYNIQLTSPNAAGLSVITGDEQADQIGAELWQDIVVLAIDNNGSPLAGVEVTGTTVGGSVSPESILTGADGTASFRWTLGNQEGEQILNLSAEAGVTVDVTSHAIANLPAFDAWIESFLNQWGIPGAGVAVALDGRLVYARGYGVADIDTQEPVKAEHRFRIASVSKPITGAAVMQLFEQGQVGLDDPAFDFLDHLEPPVGASPDPRLSSITIRNLLEHSGGWDRDASFDPMFIPTQAAAAVGAPAPASAETVIRYMLGQPLDFDPATDYAYSNFGYAVLGRVIEEVSGMSFEDYMQSEFLAPMGITRMEVAETRVSGRKEQEVRYYDLSGATASSVFPDDGVVPTPYGAFHIEAMDAHGGWIASPVDLMRFMTSVDGREDRADVISFATVNDMIARPALDHWQSSSYWYAKGWSVRSAGSDRNWWHTGLLAGTTTVMVRAHNGFSWAILVNASATDFCCAMMNAMDRLMWDAVGSVGQWPIHDLFPKFR
jgi:N-acyl-D-amino-acid deacylase